MRASISDALIGGDRLNASDWDFSVDDVKQAIMTLKLAKVNTCNINVVYKSIFIGKQLRNTILS